MVNIRTLIFGEKNVSIGKKEKKATKANPPIAGELKRLRLKAGWNQADLAEQLGASQPFVSQIEGGYYQSMSFETVAKLCEVFSLPLRHFIPFLAPGIIVPDLARAAKRPAVPQRMPKRRA